MDPNALTSSHSQYMVKTRALIIKSLDMPIYSGGAAGNGVTKVQVQRPLEALTERRVVRAAMKHFAKMPETIRP